MTGFLLILSFFALLACSSKEETASQLPVVKNPLTRSESLLHTVVQLSIYHEDQESAMDGAIELIQELESLLSTSLEGSDVYRINEAAGKEAVKVDSRTFELIQAALAASKNSDGRFDITIGVSTNSGILALKMPANQKLLRLLRPFPLLTTKRSSWMRKSKRSLSKKG